MGIKDTDMTRMDIKLIGCDASTPMNYRPYWTGAAFEMRDPLNPDAPPPVPDGTKSLSMVKAGTYTVTVPDGITMAEVSGAGASGGGGAAGVNNAKPYNGASGGGGGSTGIKRVTDSSTLFEVGGGAGGNGSSKNEAVDAGRGGRGAIIGKSHIAVVPGEKLTMIVGHGGNPGIWWNRDSLGTNGGTNKGGTGGLGLTNGADGDDGTIDLYTRSSGDGGGPNAGKSLGQQLLAYNGTDGLVSGDATGLSSNPGGAGGKSQTAGTDGNGLVGNPGWLTIKWLELPTIGLAQYAKYTAANGQTVEVAWDTRIEKYVYRLSGMTDFVAWADTPTDYTPLVTNAGWRNEGTKIKLTAITNTSSGMTVALVSPSQLGGTRKIGLRNTDGFVITVVGWDAFYQDRFTWNLTYFNSDFAVE